MHSVNLAHQTGRALQKEQTGFVHVGDTIPILENALFAFALFRSRVAENVLEGKELIEKLLAFEVSGFFPAVLHEYPRVLDPFINLRLAPLFFWIGKDFSHVIGGLKVPLKNCLERMLQSIKTDLPPWAAFRLAAFEGKIETLPTSLFEWGEALISLQIAEKQGANIVDAIQEAVDLWHSKLSLYIGPAFQRHQRGFESDLSVFDLFMCQWQSYFPKRMDQIHPIALRGSLVRPLGFEPHWKDYPVPYSLFNPDEECPVLIAWKGHSFVLAKKHLTVQQDGEMLLLRYPKELPDTEDKSLEVNFYLDYHSGHQFFVNGKKANTFQSGDVLEIHSNGVILNLQFFAEGGTFFGHLMRGNRPSQHACCGENEFTAYDWRICIRTVSRKPNAMLRVQLTQQMLQSQSQRPLHASHCPHTG